jgi:hypothetical protein
VGKKSGISNRFPLSHIAAGCPSSAFSHHFYPGAATSSPNHHPPAPDACCGALLVHRTILEHHDRMEDKGLVYSKEERMGMIVTDIGWAPSL